MATGPPVEVSDVSAARQQATGTMRDLQGIGDIVMDFTKEFRNIWEALTASHEEEEQFVEQVKALIVDVDQHKAAIGDSQAEQKDLEHSKTFLEEEVGKVTSELERVGTSVASLKDKADTIRAESEKLSAVVRAGSGWTTDQKLRSKELEETRDDLRAQLEGKQTALNALRRDIDALQEHIDRGEAFKSETTTEIDSVKAEIQAIAAKMVRLTKTKESSDEELKALQESIDTAHRTLVDKQAQVRDADGMVASLESALKAKKLEVDRFLQNYNALHKRTAQLTDELDSQMVTNESIELDLRSIAEQTAVSRKEAAAHAAETAKYVKLHDLAAAKIVEAEEKSVKVDAEMAAMEATKKELREKIDKVEKETAQVQRAVEDLAKERDILRATMLKATDRSQHVETLIRVQQGSQRTLENEILGVRKEIKGFRDRIEDLLEERERMEGDMSSATQKYFTVLEQVKLQDVQVDALQRKAHEAEAKLKKQQAMYESVRSDRNMYSKNLVEVQEEIEVMNLSFRTLSHQVDQYKEEITLKDHRLVKEHFDHHSVEKQKDALKAELQSVKRQMQSSKQIIEAQSLEMKKLTAVITEAELERDRQRKEFASVLSERDVLRTQLMKRDAELSALYEKLKIQRSKLDLGRSTFEAQKKVEAELKAQIADLKSELQLSKLQVSNVDDLKAEIFRLEKEMIHEKAKVAALSAELQRPINIHRWRQLEGSNPKLFEMITKVQSLQKRLIAAHEEMVQRDARIKEKEKLYADLRTVLARQPGPEISEQLVVYQQNLKQKQKQLRAMELELETYKGQVGESKREIERVGGQLDALQKQFVKKALTLSMGGGGGGGGGAGGPGVGSYSISAGGGGDLGLY